MEEITSTVSGGFDYKTYDANSFKTNNFKFVEITLDAQGFPNPPVVSQVSSPVPATYVPVRYLPMTVRWDGSRKDTNGVWVAGFGYSVNFFGGLFSNSSHNFRTATGSAYGDGFYHVLTGSLSREQVIFRDWRLTLRADGQWANEPLITNEEFSTGGVSSVRGYHEGEIFGDRGWHISLEQKSPGLLVGTVGRNAPLIFRGSIFMDYAESYLLDPQSRNGHTTLWGTGLGFVASIGSAWDARFLFGVPLLSAGTIEAYQPYFNFSLTAQF
jgi:hemolysin activation/secretion protein